MLNRGISVPLFIFKPRKEITMKTASTITVTTAEVVVSIKDESGSIIMEKTLSLAIPEFGHETIYSPAAV